VKILIVDDSLLVRMMLKDCLVKAGFKVVTAANFKEAEVMFALFHPQIIIKDLYMKGWNLVDSIRFFKELDSEVKIILCTTLSCNALIIEGLKAGATDFLVKPLDQEKVLNLVKKLAAS